MKFRNINTGVVWNVSDPEHIARLQKDVKKYEEVATPKKETTKAKSSAKKEDK